MIVTIECAVSILEFCIIRPICLRTRTAKVQEFLVEEKSYNILICGILSAASSFRLFSLCFVVFACCNTTI